ncbi:MAG: CAP domain-containing protein [Thermoguttaceae bacterium]
MLAPLLLCALLAAPADEEMPAQPASVEKFELIAIEKTIVEQTNAQRARYGLPALAVDDSLMKTARSHTIWMARARSLQHSQGVAENIAMGYPTTDAAVGGWMNSSGHRANILNRGYRRIGVAAYQSGNGTIYWCQQFRW